MGHELLAVARPVSPTHPRPPCDCTRSDDGELTSAPGAYFCHCYGAGIEPIVCSDCGADDHEGCGEGRS